MTAQVVEIVTEPEGARVYSEPSGVLMGRTPLKAQVGSATEGLTLIIRKVGYHEKRIVMLSSAGERPLELQRSVREPWSWRAEQVTKLPAHLIEK